MDNIKGVSNFVTPPTIADVKTPQTPQEKPAGEQKDQVQLGDNQPTLPDAIKPKKKWLFLNYIAADCNLKEFQMKNIDNQELVGSDPNTHVVAYIDVGPQPNPLDQTWSGGRGYYVTKDDVPNKLNSEVFAEFPKLDMSNPKTLTNFIVDAIGKFPSDHVALILNDHGGGFTGAMADDSDGDFMSVPQIRQALEDAEKVTGKKIDIVGFDACLMQEAEVAYELRNNANILLASEESEGGPGWTYNSMLGGENMAEAIKKTQDQLGIYKINVGPEEFAKIVVNVNNEHNNDIPTFSAVDLKKMDQFKDSLNDFAKAVRKSDDKESVKGAIQGAENFGQGWSPYGDIRDVAHMCKNLVAATKDPALKTAAENVLKSQKDVVMAFEVNPNSHPNCEGISVYAPTDKTALEAKYEDLAFAKDSEWAQMLKELGVGGPKPPGEGGDENLMPRFWPDGSPRKNKPN
jgi:hypothetical protein